MQFGAHPSRNLLRRQASDGIFGVLSGGRMFGSAACFQKKEFG
jgi:hypothetical protein